MTAVVEQMLSRYPRETDTQTAHAMREVMQEIALAGLNRGGFFEKAAFYGGTCLRIFHGLPRFSEDLDFSLLSADPAFRLTPYFGALLQEFAALGFEVEITEKQKTAVTDIASAFLKKSSSLYDIKINGQKTLKIKFEVDTERRRGSCLSKSFCFSRIRFTSTASPCPICMLARCMPCSSENGKTASRGATGLTLSGTCVSQPR